MTPAELDALVARGKAALSIDNGLEVRELTIKLAAAIESLRREMDELLRDRQARNAISASDRLHNICDHLAEQRHESPYDEESWRLADEDNKALRKRAEAAERERDKFRMLLIRAREQMFHKHDHGPEWDEFNDTLRAIDAALQEPPHG